MFRVHRWDSSHPATTRVLSTALAFVSLSTLPFQAALAAGAPRTGHAPAVDRSLVARLGAHRVQADTDGNKLFDNLEARLATARNDQPLDVVVRYRSGCSPAAMRVGDRPCARLVADRSIVVRLTPGELLKLAASPNVESIEEDSRCYATRDASGASFGTTQARADFGLTGDNDGNPLAYSPKDLTIAVLDTGIDGRHPDFAGGKIIGWKDFIHGLPEPYDEDGHGTHCASIAAGGVVNGSSGVAPGASLVGVKVLGEYDEGDGPASSPAHVVASGIDWCVANKEKYGIDVLSLSMGELFSSGGQDLLSRAVDRASAAGLVVCVAAGNDGPGLYTIGSPAAAASAITVGNMRDLSKGGFALEDHSSRGPTTDGRIKPDLCAPGVKIKAAAANRGGYRMMTGTSMSCPFVAGVAALMRAANPSLTPEEVKRIMKETAVHFGPKGENIDFGAGRLDGYAAVAAAAGRTGKGPAVPAHLSGGGMVEDSSEIHTWVLPVDDARFPVAATLLWGPGSHISSLELVDPNGHLVDLSFGISLFGYGSRELMLTYTPSRTGKYLLRVRRQGGSGPYWIDVSAGSHTESGELVFRDVVVEGSDR